VLKKKKKISLDAFKKTEDKVKTVDLSQLKNASLDLRSRHNDKGEFAGAGPSMSFDDAKKRGYPYKLHTEEPHTFTSLISTWDNSVKGYLPTPNSKPLQLEVRIPIQYGGLKRITQSNLNMLLDRIKKLSDGNFNFTFSFASEFMEVVPDEKGEVKEKRNVKGKKKTKTTVG
jgi:hypothetical protein